MALVADMEASDTSQQSAQPEKEYKDYYCPGCGRQYDYPQRCIGTGEAPHPPIEVVSTDELKGDNPENHTPAP